MNKQKALARQLNTNEPSETGTFVVTRRMLPNRMHKERLDKVFSCYHREYNICVKHLNRQLDALFEDLWYRKNKKLYGRLKEKQKKLFSAMETAKKNAKAKDLILSGQAQVFLEALKGKEAELKEMLDAVTEELNLCINAYGLTEYDLHAWIAKHKRKAMTGISNIDIVQKVASEAWGAAQRVLYGNGNKIHFRKKGETACLSSKSSKTGIIFKPETGTVSFAGMLIPLKPVRKKDTWMQEALCRPVKYCMIKREYINGKVKYFLQSVMRGSSPEKLKKGFSTGGLDKGVSTMSFVAPGKACFVELSPEIRKYELKINKWATALERRLRLANPDNYNPDGTVKKTGRTKWKRTKGWYRALFKLKSAYRLAAVYKKQSHGHTANMIVRMCGTLVTEPTDYRALAKRSKEEAKRQAELSEVKSKNGKTKLVRKFKRKKRFGSSVMRHSPGTFVTILKEKCKKYGCDYIEVDILKYRASQYDFVNDVYIKPLLSERVKLIGGFPVQRDLFSAFLLSCFLTKSKPSRTLCDEYFPAFLEAQEKETECIRRKGDRTGNFGLKQLDKLIAVLEEEKAVA